jgi:putative ABC transport system permease protein
MRANYLKITWRNVRNNKFISFINVFGLAVGLTCCMLIALYLHRELTYDQHYKNASRLYQLGTEFTGTVSFTSAASPGPMAATLKKEFPEIEASTRLLNLFVDDKTLVQYTDPKGAVKSFYETKGFHLLPAFRLSVYRRQCTTIIDGTEFDRVVHRYGGKNIR